MSTIMEYVIQRHVHKSFGTLESHWSNFAIGSRKTAKKDRPTIEKFMSNRDNLAFGEAVTRLLAEENPHEEFRLIKRTTVVEEDVEVTYAPRKTLTVNDLREIALNPVHHDGVRIFNALVPVIKEVGLDPCNFGSLYSKFVLWVLDHMNNPVDEWVMVLSDCYPTVKSIPDFIDDREWWNVYEQAKIKYSSGINSYGFSYIDYKNGKSYGPYKTFATAVKHTANGKGFAKNKVRMPKTKII